MTPGARTRRKMTLSHFPAKKSDAFRGGVNGDAIGLFVVEEEKK
jgi:hypothetical protein